MKVDDQKFPNEAVAALERGGKIEAIKIIRVARGLGLKEAKDVVEEYIKGNLGLKERMASADREATKSGLKWLIPLTAIGLWAYFYFTRR